MYDFIIFGSWIDLLVFWNLESVLLEDIGVGLFYFANNFRRLVYNRSN